MSLAARYIHGLPYDPGMGVGQYSRAPRAAAPTGTSQISGGTLPLGQTDSTGQAVRVPAVGATTLGATGSAGGGAGGSNALASLLGAAGLLQYAPEVYDWLDRQFAPTPQSFPQGWDGGSFAGPGGVQIPNAALGGLGTNWDNVFEPGSWSFDPAGAQRLLDAPMPAGDQFAGLAGDVGASNGAGAANVGAEAAGLAPGLLESGEMVWNGIDFGTAGFSLPLGVMGNMAGNSFARHGNPQNAQLGTAAGTAAGAGISAAVALGLLPALGPLALPLAFALPAAGGAIGSQIGPPPTVGRNFSSIGTFGGDGRIHWSNSGGDNGAGAADADPFANWFGDDLFQQAAAQGLQFNPAMAGVQFRVGGYDNFDRGGPTPGGYFYVPDAAGGSPENYALRPSDDFWNSAYSPSQASAFSRNVLADMTSRGAFTQAGQQGPGMDYWQSTQGTPLGWYGAQGGDYQRVQYGGDDFGNVLADRQSAVQGWLNGQQQQALEAQARANTQPIFNDQGASVGAYDLSQPVWWQGGMLNPGDQAFPTQQAAPAPAPFDPYMASVQGLPGVQMGENGPMYAGPGGGQSAWTYQDGGA